MIRTFVISLLVALILTAMWWFIPLFHNKDTGYTALGALFSAFAFAGLIGTLYAQHEAMGQANRAHAETMKLQREATRIAAASALVSSLAAAIGHIEPELERTRHEADARASREMEVMHATIDAIADRLDAAGIDRDTLEFEVRDILKAALIKGLDAKDQAIAALKSEQELEQIKLSLLSQLSSASAVMAAAYESQIEAGISEGDDRLGAMLKIFEGMYKIPPRS